MIEMRHGRLPALRPERPYSLRQLADAIGVSHRAVARWRISGARRPGDAAGSARVRLPCYRAGGQWRVMGADAAAFLRALSTPIAGEQPIAPEVTIDKGGVDYGAMAEALGL